MKILILNGNPKAENTSFDNYINKLSSLLSEQGNETSVFKLRDKNINHCIGCYACCLKTPGVCIYKDDMPEILYEYVNSDYVIFASPIIMGFISSLLKRVQERTQPLSHPYLYVKEDRLQHVPRYDKKQSIGILLDDTCGCEADIQIIDDIFRRGKTRNIAFTKTINSKPEEIAYEISNI